MPVSDSATSPYSLVSDVIRQDDVGVQCRRGHGEVAAKSIWRFTIIPPFGDSVTFSPEPSQAPAMIATTHLAFCI
jgi:hypothetical protein